MMKEEMVRKRKRGVHLDEDESEEEEIEDKIDKKRQQPVNEHKSASPNKKSSNANVRCKRR